MMRLSVMQQRLLAYAKAHPLRLIVRLLVIFLLGSFLVARRVFWTPDTLFIVLLIIFVIFGQARAFLVRFLPFIGLLLVYDSFRGIADNLNKTVHYTEMIDFDKWLGNGTLPTSWLQHYMWHGHVSWYDFYFYFLYTLHFVAPVILAIVLWKWRPKLYWPFVGALIGLSFAAFITYVVFPAAPPWMAAEHGYIQPIQHISSDIWGAMGIENYSEVYSKLSPNLVAAVPSLHAAYPVLFVLFLAKAFGWRKTWWLWVYPLSLWLGIVYLGEHYIFDVLLGAVYATLAYVASLCLAAWGRKKEFTLDAFSSRLRRLALGVHPEKD